MKSIKVREVRWLQCVVTQSQAYMSFKPGKTAATQSLSSSFLLVAKKSSQAISHWYMTNEEMLPGIRRGMCFGSAWRTSVGVLEAIFQGINMVKMSGEDEDELASESLWQGVAICTLSSEFGAPMNSDSWCEAENGNRLQVLDWAVPTLGIRGSKDGDSGFWPLIRWVGRDLLMRCSKKNLGEIY